MSTQFAALLNRNALSVAVSQESFEGEDLLDAIDSSMEARFGEISRGFAMIKTLESLANTYSEREVTRESMESYEIAVGSILHVAGYPHTLTSIIPSFEDASSDKKSFGEKTKALIARILAWIREKWEQLKAWAKKKWNAFTQFLTNMKATIKGLRTKTAKAKADGVTEVVFKAGDNPTAGNGQTRAAATSPEWQAVQRSLDADQRTVGRTSNTSIAGWMVTSNGSTQSLNVTAINTYLEFVAGIDYKKMGAEGMEKTRQNPDQSWSNTYTNWLENTVKPLRSPSENVPLRGAVVRISDLEAILVAGERALDRVATWYAANDQFQREILSMQASIKSASDPTTVSNLQNEIKLHMDACEHVERAQKLMGSSVGAIVGLIRIILVALR